MYLTTIVLYNDCGSEIDRHSVMNGETVNETLARLLTEVVGGWNLMEGDTIKIESCWYEE